MSIFDSYKGLVLDNQQRCIWALDVHAVCHGSIIFGSIGLVKSRMLTLGIFLV
jgi:hypothetical protein